VTSQTDSVCRWVDTTNFPRPSDDSRTDSVTYKPPAPQQSLLKSTTLLIYLLNKA